MRRSVNTERAGAVACSAALLALVACGDGAHESTKPAPTLVVQAPKEDSAAGAAETKGMTDGMPDSGKPGAPVALKFELQGEPSPGNGVTVEIAVLPRAASELMRVTFIATDGLAISDASPAAASATGEPAAEFRDVRADAVYRHALTVTPRENGEYYLGVIVLMNLANGPEVRTFNIPVLVGEESKARTAAHKSPPPPVDATGQPIQSMKAEPPDLPRGD